MPFDDTILNLILDGDQAAAEVALDAGHPDAFVQTIGAVVEHVDLKSYATSGSSNSIGTGTKVFTLDSTRGFIEGTPVYIMDAAAPGTNFMAGLLTADETAGGGITVDVTTAVGSGTYTDWRILALFTYSEIVTPPVAIADGGTGVSTAALARGAFELVRVFQVLGILSTPPGGPTTGDAYIIGESPTGAWSANEGDVATYNGSTWDFETPVASDQAFDADTSEQYLYNGTENFSGGLWGGSYWSQISGGSIRETDYISATSSIDVADLSIGKLFRLDPTSAGGTMTVTIPNPGTPGVFATEIVLINETAGTTTINVASGGSINAGLSIDLVGIYAYARLIAGQSGGGGRWFIISEG